MICLLISPQINAQFCPENIGFENGNFQFWKLYTGSTYVAPDNKNVVDLAEVSTPSLNRHTLFSNKSLVDPYGKFSIIPANGGNYVVKLGDSGTGAQAEGISYIINVPTNRPEFTLTYQYAVVLQDPNHIAIQQPRFVAKVTDLATNQQVSCASFEYIATSTLPGFKKSTVSADVIYKDWTPVTINLSGYQGKQLLIEFITADCTAGGHFGYAYVDVNALCGDIVVGNIYCKSADFLNMEGPSGFKGYSWYNEDRSVVYGTGQNVVIKPTPALGSKILLDLIPYDGYGCPSTVTAVVQDIDYQLQVLPKNTVCQNELIDLTSSNYILNKSSYFTYIIYEDKDLTQQVKGLAKITANKTYYVKATNFKGCESVGSIDISIFDVANMTSKNSAAVCYNETVDITKDEYYLEGSLADITKTYFSDANATISVPNPTRINVTGRYYVKLTNSFGCFKTVPLDVTITKKPLLKVTDPALVCFPNAVDISFAKNFVGSDPDFTYTFFYDAFFNQPISDPTTVDKSGTYYIKATNTQGCVVTDKITVVIIDLPVLMVKDPAPVCFPEQVDITNPDLYTGTSTGATYTYFYDKDFTKPIEQPKQIGITGSYFVKITNSTGCFVFSTIHVVVNPLPVMVLTKPKTIFDYDATDLTSPEISKGTSGYVKAYYYEDAALKKPVANPTQVKKSGTYYIVFETDKGCTVAGSVDIIILAAPVITVPTGFTPQKETNNRLFPFFVSIQKLISFKVYNKWGVLVYQTNDMTATGWDGMFKAKLQSFETFSWFAEGIDVLGGKYQSKGKTILIL